MHACEKKAEEQKQIFSAKNWKVLLTTDFFTICTDMCVSVSYFTLWIKF